MSFFSFPLPWLDFFLHLFWSILINSLLIFAILFFFAYLFRLYFRSKPVRQPYSAASNSHLVVGFFHPYCNSGGGGERVLWQAVQAVQALSHEIHILIYTGDSEAGEDILHKAQVRFHLPPFQRPVEFVRLTRRSLVEADKYPRFTMIGQSWGSVLLALEALLSWRPHVFIDTTGFAFTYPLARYIFGCSVCAYVHYPTISLDMLQLVWERRPTYNHSAVIAKNPVWNFIKLTYYSLFAVLYSLVGRSASLIFTNSTWTFNHILSLWRAPDRTFVLYPPCDTATLQELSLEDRHPLIISIGQFRPEKDHSLQLKAFHSYIQRTGDKQIKLVLIGGCRDSGDEQRVEVLKKEAISLGIENQIEFAINIPFPDLLKYLSQATAGLHTMWNEHFGIGVVEFMAAGVIPIAHNSGGPKLDIVKDGEEIGYLARSTEEYSDALVKIFSVSKDNPSAAPTQLAMRIKARAYVDRFSDQQFIEGFENGIQPLLEASASASGMELKWTLIALAIRESRVSIKKKQ
jgi:alpha-1,2-mannosyltransferase